MKPAIILDKCYLFSAKKEAIHKLEDEYTIFLPLELIYEAFKDTDRERAKLFRKFRSGKSYKVLRSITEIIKYEAENKKPIAKPSKIYKPRDHSQHINYIDDNYQLNENQKREIEQEMIFFDNIFNLFCEHSLKPGFQKKKEMGNNITNKQDDFIIKDDKLKEIINHNIKKGYVSGFTNEIENLDEKWFIFIHHKILDRMKFHIIKKYENFETILKTPKTKEKVKHDIIDSFYLMQGILEGGFATDEKNLIEIYNEIVPNNILITNEKKAL